MLIVNLNRNCNPYRTDLAQPPPTTIHPPLASEHGNNPLTISLLLLRDSLNE
jgi:hypothetical protein